MRQLTAEGIFWYFTGVFQPNTMCEQQISKECVLWRDLKRECCEHSSFNISLILFMGFD